MTRKGGTIGWEAAENQLNVLIERRAREAEDANHAAQAWAESARRYNLAHSAERRAAWVEWHRQQAERHRRTLTDLIAHHESAAAHLAGEGTVTGTRSDPLEGG